MNRYTYDFVTGVVFTNGEHKEHEVRIDHETREVTVWDDVSSTFTRCHALNSRTIATLLARCGLRYGL